MPYAMDNPTEAKIDNVPVWLLQALRETVVFQIENEKGEKPGAKPDDRMKYLASIAMEKAEIEKKATNTKMPKYKIAQKHLIDMGEGLQPETIKKYAARFNKENQQLSHFGKYFGMSKEDQSILEAVIAEIKKGID